MAAKWKFAAGSRPNTVTVFERESGGMLYARAWNAGGRRFHRMSLGHRDKARAKRYAIDEAAKLQKGEAGIADGKLTLVHVFALYEQHRTPRKSLAHQKEDRRRVELFTRFLGNIDPHRLTLRQWESFIDARTSGAIDPRGNPVPEKERRLRRPRAVEIDLRWLKAVLNWANKWKLETGRYLMRENPARGYEMPVEKNPRRPVATRDRFDALRAISDAHAMSVGRRGTRLRARSYLSELLDIAAGTGRRINAICSLRYDDLTLERQPSRPNGAICWPEDADKMGYITETPISAPVRAALDRILHERPALGRVPLFPSPENPSEPVSYRTASKWLVEAEKAAGLKKQQGGLWHPYRRGWATSRKNLPSADVAAAGGWRSTDTLKLYQRCDEQTILRVVLAGEELRQAR
jgi:integrase